MFLVKKGNIFLDIVYACYQTEEADSYKDF